MSESSELTLFMDPYKIEFPSLVKEVLSQTSKNMNICATLTPQQQCVLLCSNVMYVWTCSNKSRVVPHAFRLSLPATGLRYYANSVCVFKKSDGRVSVAAVAPSVLAVSPEGYLRYWSDAGKPSRDQNINLQNDVAFSICLIESLGHLDRFLLSTATSSFYIVEIFHSMSEQSERISVRALEMDTPDGIGRRMSKMLFGYATERESVTKTIFVKGRLKTRMWTS
uniref:Nucleoporin Nup133/Nup155-like N-terminal domain-containing protein n=1 Tax=Ditylenchus dipsaci TaxID=166011 RepID=A0A915ERF2_9BILA